MPDDTRPATDPLSAVMLAVADQGDQLNQHAGRLDDYGGRLTGLTGRLLAMERLLEGEPDQSGYCPVPAPRWWLLAGPARADALDRIAAWVDQVYTRSYGHVSRTLAACWREHDLCLFVLDFVSELHSLLYLQHARSARTLADQAEFHLRVLPAATELMRAETARCDHVRLKGVAG